MDLIGFVLMYCNMRPWIAVADIDLACWIGASLAEIHLSSTQVTSPLFEFSGFSDQQRGHNSEPPNPSYKNIPPETYR